MDELDPSGAAECASRLCANVERALRGKPEVVQRSVEALITGGHLLIEDVPGVGKTTLAHALARSIDAKFRRIQFTSDLLPSDVLGSSLPEFQDGRPTGRFAFQPGPLFAQIVLADEINRASPKTQSALLEAMCEGQVTLDGLCHVLPSSPPPRPPPSTTAPTRFRSRSSTASRGGCASATRPPRTRRRCCATTRAPTPSPPSSRLRRWRTSRR